MNNHHDKNNRRSQTFNCQYSIVNFHKVILHQRNTATTWHDVITKQPLAEIQFAIQQQKICIISAANLN